MSGLPGRVSILRFRHLLEQHRLAMQFLVAVNARLGAKGHMLKEGTAVDATLIAAPSSTKNRGGESNPDMHQSRPIALRLNVAYATRGSRDGRSRVSHPSSCLAGRNVGRLGRSGYFATQPPPSARMRLTVAVACNPLSCTAVRWDRSTVRSASITSR